MPLTGKEMCKLLKKAGFELVPGGGKGSHRKFIKGELMTTVPMHGELRKGTEKNILKVLERAKRK